MSKKQNRQKPSKPSETLKKAAKGNVPPWMSDDTRVVFSEERNHEDG